MTQGDTYNNSNNNSNTGIRADAGTKIEIKDGAKVVGSINGVEKQNLTKAAAGIQALLEQLSKTYRYDTNIEKRKLATAVLESIENDKSLMNRIVSALKAGGSAALEQALSHPLSSFIISALEDWQRDHSQ